ncbi:MAG: glycosyl hydrolase [Chloroflexi bacterium]|nr:glycosyl hydrolase [Chloroflexota bacterium]
MTGERAVQAYAAMQRHLYLQGARLYRESVPTAAGGNPFAYVWPFEEAAKAALYMRGLPDVGHQYAADIENVVDRLAYWQPRRRNGIVNKPSYASYPPFPLGQGGDTYLDDNTWIALDIVQAYRMRTGGRPARHDAGLERAGQILDLVSAAWASDAQPYPGGVYWVDATWNRDRGAAVTAGLAALAAHLHDLTEPAGRNGRATVDRVQTAIEAYRWLRATLWIEHGSEAGLYHDKVLGDGRIDTAQWIYNQGVPVAAGVMLHRITGDTIYLEQAEQTAEAALAWYGRQSYAGQPAIFVAIFFRNLLQLAAVTGARAYHDEMLAYADRAWRDPSIHDRATGLFHFEGPGRPCTLLDQAAMVQLLALGAWPTEQYRSLA